MPAAVPLVPFAPRAPFRQFVLKVRGRCNLSCTYCCLYHGRDTGWRDRPARVSEATMARTAQRVAEHARAHDLRELRIDLHGGEPLMSGPGEVLAYTAAIREAVGPDRVVHAAVQTNGTRLTRSALARLAEAGIGVGISLDGGTATLNRHRVDHAGRPSWPAASRAARLLADHPEAYAGLLCAVDVRADPAEVYRSLLALRPPRLDLLLPHANWSSPPPRPEGAPRSATPYGDWLAAVFDLWWNRDADERPHPRVRLFTEIVGLLLGVPSATESVGLSPTVAVVVETDGAIAQIDSLKVAYDRATVTGLDVHHHSFDEALAHPGIAARQLGAAALAAVCRGCPVVRVCGGGNYAHRYREGSGFAHPSVYCADLERLIRHIAHALSSALPHDTVRASAAPVAAPVAASTAVNSTRVDVI
ncbi:FxsB family cyclophane-forming radical SAM/SPASM peptide maturase [Streptantibioticus parmotrematis]|uniref:FxsB family cyclophane-forming radical SAM/SPASM peptide maturase n=1 Tax=Streptantibioticus parmotrematis TaxID=2873249 RepID=UPI0033CA0B7B